MKAKIISDIAMREIEVKWLSEFAMSNYEARRAAEEHLEADGSGDNWSFDSVERLSDGRAKVYFVGV